jgi:DNA topoisomerase-1
MGEEVQPEEIKYTQHWTKPPERYTEASLIKKMEELGIGRPSTYAPTLTILKKRNYVELEKRKLKPTETAFKVIELLETHFPNIVDSNFTAEMEEMLDQIASGSKEWQQVLREFYYPFEEQVKEGYQKIPSQKVEKPTGERCPECGGELVIRKNRYGQEFIGCKNFPNCRYTRPLTPPEVVEGVKCPECGGDIVIKSSRRGKFFGCSNYPKCRFATSYRPTPHTCPECGYMMGERELRGAKVLECLKCKHRIPVSDGGAIIKKTGSE